MDHGWNIKNIKLYMLKKIANELFKKFMKWKQMLKHMYYFHQNIIMLYIVVKI